MLFLLSTGKPKDPGIPNLYPFKEQLLKQIEERKEKVSVADSFVMILAFNVRCMRKTS